MTECTIGDICTWSKGFQVPRDETSVNKEVPYLHYGDLYKKYDFRLNLQEKYNEIIKIDSNPKIKDVQYLHDGDIVFALTSETVDDLGHCTLISNSDDLPFVSGMETTVIHIKRRDSVLPSFLNYYFHDRVFQNKLRQYVTGMKVYRVHPDDIMSMTINLPSVEEQEKIVRVLDAITDDTSCLTKINDNLSEQGQAIFNELIINGEAVSEERLTDIAHFQNGLPMQKNRPIAGEGLPVLKIKELSQGHCDDSSERCRDDIDHSVLINNGDVVFSWSGSLMAKIWCGEKCGLNQHLFKVTSEKYPLWFYYYWLQYHMPDFIDIAANKATTMGHICRNHLDDAIVSIPRLEIMKKADSVLSPIIDAQIKSMEEITQLTVLRDYLLPKLMSGEIDVSTLEIPN